MNRKHFELYIKGRVQGVRFRMTCKEMADSMGIKGLVKNLPDGSVYAEAEGDINALIDFLAWCKQGPPLAQVDELLTVEGPAKGHGEFYIV